MLNERGTLCPPKKTELPANVMFRGSKLAASCGAVISYDDRFGSYDHSAASLAPFFLCFPAFASTGAKNLPV
jgi:hypothetical protein